MLDTLCNSPEIIDAYKAAIKMMLLRSAVCPDGAPQYVADCGIMAAARWTEEIENFTDTADEG